MPKDKLPKPQYRHNPLGFPLTYGDECRMLRAMRMAEHYMKNYGRPPLHALPPIPEKVKPESPETNSEV